MQITLRALPLRACSPIYSPDELPGRLPVHDSPVPAPDVCVRLRSCRASHPCHRFAIWISSRSLLSGGACPRAKFHYHLSPLSREIPKGHRVFPRRLPPLFSFRLLESRDPPLPSLLRFLCQTPRFRRIAHAWPFLSGRNHRPAPLRAHRFASP